MLRHRPLLPIAQQAAASLLRFITCGSVDDGKSTLIGRLLYDSKNVLDDQLVTLDKDSKKFGTQGENIDFALLVDGLSAEREQGITIDVAYRYFATRRRSFIVADTPGHEQYTRNMATGASTAELAIILVDARKGILPQTRRHSFIVSMLGVKQIVVAINKMDLVDFDQGTFERIAGEYRAMAADLHFASIVVIPLSARDGDNMTGPSPRTPWYHGPSLLDYLETVEASTSRTDEGFRFPVQWVSRPNLDFRGFAGWVASGTVKPGETIMALPSGRTSRVERLVTADGDLAEAGNGQSVTITLADEIDISRGDVLVKAGDSLKACTSFSARLLWTSETAMPAQGGRYRLKLATCEANAEIASLNHVLDIHTFEKTYESGLAMNGIGLVTITLDKPLVVTPYEENRTLGAFILIDRLTHETVAMGTVRQDGEDEVKPAARVVNLASRLLSRSGEEPRRSFLKAVTWRLAGSLVTFALAYVLTQSLIVSGSLVAAEMIVKTVLYFLHERAWANSGFGLAAGQKGG